MALVKCPECGKTTFTFKTALTILGSVLLIGGVAFGIISGFADNEPEKTPDPAAQGMNPMGY